MLRPAEPAGHIEQGRVVLAEIGGRNALHGAHRPVAGFASAA